jgi:signal transduction histidine kinase
VAELRHILPEIQSLTSEIRDVFDKVVRSVVQTLGYPAAMLAVVDEKQHTLTVQAIAYSQFMYRYSWDMLEKMLEIRIIGSTVSLVDNPDNLGVQSCLSEQAQVSPLLYDVLRPVVSESLSARIQESTGIHTCIAIPLKVKNEVVGVLCAGVDNTGTPPTGMERLHFLATNAAIAIKNSTHFTQISERLLQREIQLKQLRRIDRILNGSLELRHVLENILNGALELTQAEAGEVVLVGRYATDLIQRVSYPEKLNLSGLDKNSLPDWLNAVTPVVKNPPLTHKTGGKNQYEEQPCSFLAVPITFEDELVAAIRIISHKSDTFNDQTQDTLEQLAVQAAIAIKNAYQFKVKQAMQQQLANVAQVAAMGDMASNMVHSINNWVGAIRADLKYMSSLFDNGQCTEPEEINELLTDMLVNAEATLDMAKNIKKPFQPLEKELIDVNECIRSVLQEKQREMPDIVRVEDLNPAIPAIMATRQLELVFDNLINNALQAMQGQVNGVLKLETHLSKDQRWVEIIVQDSGVGLPKHFDSVSIFRLGVSGRPGGLGYGLWWCDTFLKRWGGEIKVVEDTKRGCKFLVRLPVANKIKE